MSGISIGSTSPLIALRGAIQNRDAQENKSPAQVYGKLPPQPSPPSPVQTARPVEASAAAQGGGLSNMGSGFGGPGYHRGGTSSSAGAIVSTTV